MSEPKRAKGVKLKPRIAEEKEEVEIVTAEPPGDIYESVVRDLGFDPIKEQAARRT